MQVSRCRGRLRLQCMVLAAAGQNHAARSGLSPAGPQSCVVAACSWPRLCCIWRSDLLAHCPCCCTGLSGCQWPNGAAGAARSALLDPLMLLCRSEAAHGNLVCC